MTPAAAWRPCLVAGLLTLACSRAFGLIPGLQPCGSTGGLGPVLAFEFARSPAELAALFGDDPCRSTLIAAQRTALWLDALGFIPSYTAFLCCAAWASGHRRRAFVIALLLLGAAADEVEGVLLFTLLNDLRAPVLLAVLPWPVLAKFLMLIAGTLGMGAMLLEHSRLLARLVGATMFAAGTAMLFASGPYAATMMQAFTIAWTALLLLAGAAVFRPRLLASPPPMQAPPSA